MSETKPPKGYEATEYVPQQVELMYETGDLAVWSRIDSTYEILATRDGAIIAHLTEPEDRTFFRDLKPIILELAQLRTKAAAYDEIAGSYAKLIGSMKALSPDCFSGKHKASRCELCAFIAREIAANRFTP